MFIDEPDHFRRFGASSDAKKPVSPWAIRWYRATPDLHGSAWQLQQLSVREFTVAPNLLHQLPDMLPHRQVFGQNTILYQADHTVLSIPAKFLWHTSDFPIYSEGTKPGTLRTCRFS